MSLASRDVVCFTELHVAADPARVLRTAARHCDRRVALAVNQGRMSEGVTQALLFGTVFSNPYSHPPTGLTACSHDPHPVDRSFHDVFLSTAVNNSHPRGSREL